MGSTCLRCPFPDRDTDPLGRTVLRPQFHRCDHDGRWASGNPAELSQRHARGLRTIYCRARRGVLLAQPRLSRQIAAEIKWASFAGAAFSLGWTPRSEERRVGKECVSTL